MQVQVSLKMEIAATASLSQMEQQIQEAGQQAMREALKQAVRQWEDQRVCSAPAPEASSAEKAEQPMLVGVDGGWVCSREQRGGMEGKVAVVSAQVEELPMPRADPTFSWSQRGARRAPRQRHRLAQ